nr:hypothetical protein CFP56_10691 [Quercus suber]
MCGNGGSVQEVTRTQQEGIPKFEFTSTPKAPTRDCQEGLDLVENGEGPTAMTYELEVGWVTDKLGPNSGHWKRRARARPGNENREETGLFSRKREGPTPLNKLDQNIKEAMCKKGEV